MSYSGQCPGEPTPLRYTGSGGHWPKLVHTLQVTLNMLRCHIVTISCLLHQQYWSVTYCSWMPYQVNM